MAVRKIYLDSTVLKFQDDDQVAKDLDSMVKGENTTFADCDWVIDEDDMSSDSAVDVPSQQSVKAYVDSIASSDGWVASGKAWTYASADDPTFTFTIASFDATTQLSVGMRIKLTQTTAKYFIITKVVFDDPGSTVTIYGGTDYDLANAAITLPYYSTQKAPLGFSLDPEDWTIEVTDATTRSQAAAVQNTWYNLGTVSVDIPIGVWHVSYKLVLMSSVAGNNLFVTLSTANNSESNVDYTRASRTKGDTFEYESINCDFPLNIATKDTYYLNTRTTTAGAPTIYNDNAGDKLIIRAVCSYL